MYPMRHCHCELDLTTIAESLLQYIENDEEAEIDFELYYNPQTPMSITERLCQKGTDNMNSSEYELFNTALFMKLNDRKITNEVVRIRDKLDMATNERVLDPRTRMIAYKLLNKNLISQMNGIISTGKEANVYHATAIDDKEYAVKIYKTSTLEFKDRHKYLEGEFRFRHGYSRSNSRKMVRLWAEKEMRNLTRLFKADINVPEPIHLRSNVLVMEFIGENGRASPLLKYAKISRKTARVLYRDCIAMMWKMLNICKLVHADLSEYNILYHNHKLVIIDVSQSVEYDHPYAFEFLSKDCTNISNFFRKKGVATLTVEELFDFITDATIKEKNFEECLEKLSKKVGFRDFYEITAQEQIDEEAFKNIYMQKKFLEVLNYDYDINKTTQGETDDLAYKKIAGFNEDLTGTVNGPDILQEDNPTESDYESYSDEYTSEENNKSKFKSSARPRDESPVSKKARKKAVKEEQAEKRKTKTKKHIKKRREKLSKRRH